MESITLSQIASAVSLTAPVLWLLAVFGVVYYTRSRHMLLRRIWHFMHGTAEINDPQIRKFVDDQSSLIGFRLYSGIAAQNLKDAQQLIMWAEDNEIEIERLRDCGKYFDPKTRTVLVNALPSHKQRLGLFVRLMAVTMLALLCVIATYPSQVLFSFKETGRFFVATATEARPLWPWDAGVLRSADCLRQSSGQAMQSPFTGRETELTCEIFAAPEILDFMRQQLRAQRATLGAFVPVLIFLIFVYLRTLSRAAAAKALHQQNFDPALQNGQMSLQLER